MEKIHKPVSDIPAFYQPYMNLVPDDENLISHLQEIITETSNLIEPLTADQLSYRYAKDKWTIKDILLHLSDCERILVYRINRIARNDKTDLPGFDEKLFVLNAGAAARSVKDMLQELSICRAATIFFLQTLPDEALNRIGFANGYPLSARLLANHIYGHHKHHLNIIKEKYLQH
jgi:hypothetical protein